MTYEEFKEKFLPQLNDIRSFAGKKRLADQYLTRIGSGSGRAVYDIDDEKVLKLALNRKGIAQNEVESGMMNDYYIKDLITQVFDASEDNTWIIAEKAKKVSKKRIEQLENIPDFTRMAEFLVDFEQSNKSRQNYQRDEFTQEEKEFFWDENDFSSSLLDFIGNYGQSAGDMTRPSSYGEVIRDGQPAIVLTDYGLNDEVYDTYYSGKNKQRYQMYELFQFADGNDDILSDIGSAQEIKHGMWAQMPYSVSDGDGVINEEFIGFVNNRNKYPDKSIDGLPELTDRFHECVNNLKSVLESVEDKKRFYENLLKLQEYLIRRGFYNREPLISEEYQINENAPDVEPYSLNNRGYADKLAKAVAEKLGLGAPKYIGGGSNGFAYEINNNVVMKLTSDISEADAASKTIRTNPQYIADIYNLYKVIDTDSNQAFFVVMQENIKDKPIHKIKRNIEVINQIKPQGMGYEDIMTAIRKPKRFDYGEMLEFAKHVLTDNPEASVSESDRKAAHEFLIGMLNIRKELLEYDIKSTDYITTENLGYKNGVLTFFDVGGYFGVTEPDVGDENIITLPENVVIGEKYDRDVADRIANQVGNKLGVNTTPMSGGNFGVAYDIGNDRVLKITKDNSEAAENLMLIGKPLKYIAQPYNVYEIESKNKDIPKTYAIILEKLDTNPNIKRQYDRLEYVFNRILDVGLPDVIEHYLDEWDNPKVDKNKIDSYFKKNPQDAEFFSGLLRIANEAKNYGIASMDYLNSSNLGYKKNGVLGFFDVGFGNAFLQPQNLEKIDVNEDGTSIYSTDNEIGTDGFPPYDNSNIPPDINNNLDANVSSQMYEDLEYNHVSDATEDQYVLTEERLEDFIYNNEKQIDVYKNPKSIKRMTDSLRGILDKEGNLYVINDSYNVIHNVFAEWLNLNGYPVAENTYYNLDSTVPLQRFGNTDTFYLSESIKEDEIQDNLENIILIIRRAKQKLPQYDFVIKSIDDADPSTDEPLTEDAHILREVVKGGEYHVYHGSETEINRFVDDFVGAEEATDQEGPGIYFTTSFEEARGYGKYVYSVILKPRKLVDESSHENINTNELVRLIKTAPDWKMHAQDWAENPQEGLRTAVNSMMRYSENEKDLFQQVWYDFFRYNPVEYVRGMVKLGYDGQIIDKEEGRKHIIVYNPDIIEPKNTEVIGEDRKKSWVSGSKAVEVKKNCQLGGKSDGTSDACNQGDIGNLKFSSLNEVVAKTQEEVDNFIADSKVKETVYHGSPVGGLEDFNLDKGKEIVTSSGLREEAMYFTSNPRLADKYRSGRQINPEFKKEIEHRINRLNNSQMTVRNNRDYDEIEKEKEKLRKKLVGDVYGVKLKIKNPLIFDAKGKSNSLSGSGWDEFEIDLGYKIARGKEAINLIATRHHVAKDYWKYDGIIAKNIVDLDYYSTSPNPDKEYGGNAYVVFSPNQVLILEPELVGDETPVTENSISLDEESEYQKYSEKSSAHEDRINKMYEKIDKLQAENNLKYLKPYLSPDEMRLVYNDALTSHKYFNTGKNPYRGAHAFRTAAWEKLENDNPQAYKEYVEKSNKLYNMFKAVQNFSKKKKFGLDNEFQSDDKFGMGGDIGANELSHFTTTQNAISILRDGYFMEGDEGGVAFTTNKDLVKQRKPVFYHPQGDWYEGTTHRNLSTQFVLDFNKIRQDGVKYKKGSENIGTHVGEEEIRVYPKNYELPLQPYLKKVIFDPSKEKREELSQELINLLKEKNIRYYVKNSDEMQKEKGEIGEYYSSLVPDVDEGVGDKYAEKFGIEPEFSDFERQYKIKQNEDNIIHIEDDGWGIIKNPRNLDNVGRDVRGIITKNGDLYVETFAKKIHNNIVDVLIKKRIVGTRFQDALETPTPQEYLSVQRYHDTNKMLVGESNDAMQDDLWMSDNWRKDFGIPSKEEVLPAFQKFLDDTKRKNQGIDFVNEHIAVYKRNMMGIKPPTNINEAEVSSLQELPFKQEIENEGGEIYLVGGTLRDELLGRPSKDLDIVIRGIPEPELENILRKYGKVNVNGKSFAVTKFIPDGGTEEIDIALPRTEVSTGEGHKDFEIRADHRLPIEKDLERRDFTINAIARDTEGNLIDPFNGQQDLKAGKIKVTHPQSFRDDALRMLRAVRFASVLGFEIDPETRKLIAESANKVNSIAKERIQTELQKIAEQGDASEGAFLLKDTGLLKHMGIDAPLLVSNAWNNVNTLADFIYLLSHNAMSPLKFYMNNMRGDADIVSELNGLIIGMGSEDVDNSATNRSIAHNMVLADKTMKSLQSEILPEKLRVAAQELLQGRYPKTVKELAINGHDIMGSGLKGGDIGKMQKMLLINVYADKVRNTREDLLNLLNQRKGDVKEGYDYHNDSEPLKWYANGDEKDINFFVKEYDKWNGGNYADPSRESVKQFLSDKFRELANDDKLNKNLYWKLIDRELLNEDNMKRVSYSGVVLDDKSRSALLKVFAPMIPENWETIAHHMTIKMGGLEDGSEAKQDMEDQKEIVLNVSDYAMDDKVLAVGVEGYDSLNDKPHITIAVNREAGGKPVMSNNLTSWKSLGFPLKLTGKINEQ